MDRSQHQVIKASALITLHVIFNMNTVQPLLNYVCKKIQEEELNNIKGISTVSEYYDKNEIPISCKLHAETHIQDTIDKYLKPMFIRGYNDLKIMRKINKEEQEMNTNSVFYVSGSLDESKGMKLLREIYSMGVDMFLKLSDEKSEKLIEIRKVEDEVIKEKKD